MRLTLILVLMLSTAMTGCATYPTHDDMASADYGELSPHYKEAIAAHMQVYFFDPEAARYRYVKPPVKGYAYVPNDAPTLQFGYLVDVRINAKNRLGAYTGEGEYTFLVKGDSAWMLHWWTKSGFAE